MKWHKLGLVYRPKYDGSWRHSSALAPTPFKFDDKIRVYCGFRDPDGVSRIGYVDVDRLDPTRVLKVSDSPVLDVGKPGAFDDNGINLGDIIRVGDTIRMYYVGYQIVKGVKFMAFTGLAISLDNGASFQRYSDVPVMDRSDEGLYIRGIHSIEKSLNGGFRAWYSAGSSWTSINNNPYPDYHTRMIDSSDGLSFSSKGEVVLIPQGQEYRLGRARHTYINGEEKLFFTSGCKSGTYFLGYAEKVDGKWLRQNSPGINLSDSGWDNKHLCYPSIIMDNDKYYMFYNGNYMGHEGFGVAVLLAL